MKIVAAIAAALTFLAVMPLSAQDAKKGDEGEYLVPLKPTKQQSQQPQPQQPQAGQAVAESALEQLDKDKEELDKNAPSSAQALADMLRKTQPDATGDKSGDDGGAPVRLNDAQIIAIASQAYTRYTLLRSTAQRYEDQGRAALKAGNIRVALQKLGEAKHAMSQLAELPGRRVKPQLQQQFGSRLEGWRSLDGLIQLNVSPRQDGDRQGLQGGQGAPTSPAPRPLAQPDPAAPTPTAPPALHAPSQAPAPPAQLNRPTQPPAAVPNTAPRIAAPPGPAIAPRPAPQPNQALAAPQKAPRPQLSVSSQDIIAYNRQQAAITAASGVKVSVKPLIDNLARLGVNDPIVRVEPPVPGVQPALRLSRAAQELIAHKRDELRRIGGVELDVAFESLALIGMPDMRINGPSTVIEDPVLISLRRLVEAARPYADSQKHWRSLPDHIRYPGGIGRIYGYVLDTENRDVVLVGTPATTQEARLDIDVLSVLTDVVWRKGLTPAVSIDPRPDDISGPQYPRLINLPGDTIVTRIMLDADYAMKRIGLGAEKPHIPGFESWSDLVTRLSRPGRIGGRAWLRPVPLNPGSLRVSQSGRMVLYDSRVQVLSESGSIVTSGFMGEGNSDPITLQSDELFTRFYPQFETSNSIRPAKIFALLHGVTDVAIMCTLLRKNNIDFPVLDDIAKLPVRLLSGNEQIPAYFTGLTKQTVGNDGGTISLVGEAILRNRPTRRAIDRFDDFVGQTLERSTDLFRDAGPFARTISLTFTLSSQGFVGSAEIESAKLAGLRDLDRGQPWSAATHFRDAVRQDPADLDAWIYLARAAALASEFKEARDAIERALALDSDDVAARTIALEIAWLADPSFDLKAQDPTILRELSNDYVVRSLNAAIARDNQQAINNATRAVALWPDGGEGYLARGTAEFFVDRMAARRDMINAIRLLRRASADNPTDKPRLALALAVSAMQRILRATLTAARGGLVSMSDLVDDLEMAAEEASEGTTLDPKQPLAAAVEVWARAVLIDYVRNTGRRADSGPTRERANAVVSKFPNFPNALLARARLRAADNDLSGAIEDLDKAIVLNPAMANAYAIRSQVRLEQRQCALARTDMEMARKLGEETPQLMAQIQDKVREMIRQCK